jgi:membrane protein required for colicin V production
VNLFDVLILGIVNFCLIRGIFRGLIKEGIALIGVFIGFCAASSYYAWIAELLSHWFSNDPYLRMVGFLSVFLGIVIITNILIPTIKYMLGLDFIWSVDKSFGGSLGITKGFLVSCIALIIFTAFLPKGSSIIAESKLSRHMTPLFEKLVLLTPKEMQHDFFEKIEGYKKAWKNASDTEANSRQKLKRSLADDLMHRSPTAAK